MGALTLAACLAILHLVGLFDDRRALDLYRWSLNPVLAEDAVIFPPAYPQLALAQRRELSPIAEGPLRTSRIQPQLLRFESS